MKWAVIALLCVAAVAQAAPTWRVLNGSIATTLVGVAFVSDTEGFASGDVNGVGPEIMKSTNGGVDWNDCQANFGADLLLLDVDAAEQTIVVSSVFGELYSDDDGKTFNPSRGGGLSQSVRYLGKDGDGGHKFGCAGTYHFGRIQGVAVSTDGGKNFEAYSAGLFTEARYSVFPTDDVWYVSAGQWPSQDTVGAPRRRSVFHDESGRRPAKFVPRRLDDDGWSAQIAKTTDAGKTWTTVFAQNGSFYFNGIDCAPGDPTHCCAVGESTGIAAAGARIHCTTDGGATWNRTFFQPESAGHEGYSLIEIRYVDANNIWAIGGELTSIAPSAWFLQSVDGGKTWNHGVKPIFGYYGFSLSMLSDSLGFAAVDNLITQMSGVAKFTE